ncbi:MAG: cell division protein FtsQ/DivIB [Clostridium sp.]
MAKKIKQNYGNYIIDNKENILKRKKKIIRLKRTIILFIVLVSILITLALTLPTFNLSEILVSGLTNLSEENIKTATKLELGTNIFKIKTKKIEKEIVKNPYILKVDINRKYPNKISINVQERNIAFYTAVSDGFYIIDDEGIVLEKKDSIEGIIALRIEGINEANLKIGEKIKDIDEDKIEAVCNIYNFLKEKNMFEKYNISKLEINDFVDLRLYVNNLYIELGTIDKVNGKIAKGFSIIESANLAKVKGYIDVSFEGNPVIYKEK